MPSLILPERFNSAPFFGNYYNILGLNNNTSPTKEQIIAAFKSTALLYHPDKIKTSSVQPPLSYEEATACFKAINEIKANLLSNCPEVIAEGGQNANSKEEIRSAKDLSPGEQLKAVMVGYMRSARFCEYPKGTGPGVPGYWSYISGGGNDIEMGTSNYSRKYAIATKDYQVEMGAWDQPLTVLNKQERPFKIVSDPLMIQKIVTMMTDSIPQEMRDHCAKIYGSHVREKPVLTEKPFIISDPEGDNYVDSIRENADHSFTISGRNASGQPREITLFQDGEVLGFNKSQELGIVGNQFYENREEIFHHFDLDISEAIPSQGSQRRMGY